MFFKLLHRTQKYIMEKHVVGLSYFEMYFYRAVTASSISSDPVITAHIPSRNIERGVNNSR